MNKNIISMFSLIDAALSEKTVVLPDGTDFDGIYQLAKKHNIVPLVFLGLDNVQLNALPMAKEINDTIFRAIYVCQIREYEIQKLCSTFEQNQIDYMLLKGNSICGLYTKSIMRLMGDTDILIRLEQYKKISTILTELGYEQKEESDHDFLWKKKFMNLEIHKMLFSKGNYDFYAYFKDVWNMVSKKNTDKSEYVLSDEDNFVYIFTHFAKHYRISGIGFKHLIDLHIFLKSKKLDMNYVEAELEKLCLLEFYNNIISAGKCLIDGKNPTKKDEFILESIASYGTFGNAKDAIISVALREAKKNSRSAKFGFYIKRCFPPHRYMKVMYSAWCPIALLLPLAWLVRFIDLIFNRKEIIDYQLNEIKKLSDGNLTERQQLLNYVGLEFKK